MKKRKWLLVVISTLIAFVLAGCATSSTTTKKSVTTETYAAQEGNEGNFSEGNSSSEAEAPQAKTVETKTEVKQESKASGQVGVVGTTFHLIGQVIAFPFKVLVGVIEFIF